MSKQKKVNITNNIKTLFKKLVKVYDNNIVIRYKLSNNQINTKNTIFEFLDNYSSYKLKYNKLLDTKEKTELIKFINNSTCKVNNSLNLDSFMKLLEKIFNTLLQYTGYNLLLTNIKLENINYREIYYLFNSYSPVLNIYQITNDTYLIELLCSDISKELANEYNNCIMTTYDENENEENHTLNCYYIENKIQNVIVNNGIKYYLDIYNNKYTNLHHIVRKCSYDKIVYDNNLIKDIEEIQKHM
jgi:hypothetical protein